jgi:hypothetical protein
MKSTNFRSIRRLWYWLTVVPLVIGASVALLKYAGWSAVYSAYYGLPSEARRLAEAGPKAELYKWLLTGLAVTAIVVATILIPPVKSEAVPPALKGMTRFALAMVLVVGSIILCAASLSTAGHYLR